MSKSKGLGKGLSALLGDTNNDIENVVDFKNNMFDVKQFVDVKPNV